MTNAAARATASCTAMRVLGRMRRRTRAAAGAVLVGAAAGRAGSALTAEGLGESATPSAAASIRADASRSRRGRKPVIRATHCSTSTHATATSAATTLMTIASHAGSDRGSCTGTISTAIRGSESTVPRRVARGPNRRTQIASDRPRMNSTAPTANTVLNSHATPVAATATSGISRNRCSSALSVARLSVREKVIVSTTASTAGVTPTARGRPANHRVKKLARAAAMVTTARRSSRSLGSNRAANLPPLALAPLLIPQILRARAVRGRERAGRHQAGRVRPSA